MNNTPEFAIETCDQLHKFAFIVGEPKPRCPFCLAIGLDEAREELERLGTEANKAMETTGEKNYSPCHYCGDTVDSDRFTLLANNKRWFYCSPECVQAAHAIALARARVVLKS